MLAWEKKGLLDLSSAKGMMGTDNMITQILKGPDQKRAFI
jgi:hypothetical protein